MSLILEALKKSETRRHLGGAPNINTPFTPVRRRRNPLPGLLAAIVAAFIIGWWWMNRSQPAAPIATGADTTAPAGAPPAAIPNASPDAAPRNLAAKPISREPAPTARSSAAERMPSINPTLPPNVMQNTGVLTVPNPNLLKTAPGTTANAPKTLAATTTEHETEPAVDDKAQGDANPGTARALKDAAILPLAGETSVNAPTSEKPAPTQPTRVSASSASPPPAAPVPSATAPSAIATTAADANTLPLYFQLPYGLRKDLPGIKISMHVYAPEPAQRFVIINGARQIEGDALNTELTLREIRPNEIVLEFRGQKFIVPRSGT